MWLAITLFLTAARMYAAYTSLIIFKSYLALPMARNPIPTTPTMSKTDQENRRLALELAHTYALHTMNHSNSPTDIVTNAKLFEQFLRGESPRGENK